jgi:hypothetical protein
MKIRGVIWDIWGVVLDTQLNHFIMRGTGFSGQALVPDQGVTQIRGLQHHRDVLEFGNRSGNGMARTELRRC